MKRILIGLTLLSSVGAFANNSQEFLCDQDTDYPAVITVTDGAITNYVDRFYETECVVMLSKEEAAAQVSELEKNLSNASSSEAKEELKKYIELFSNNPSACTKKDPPSVASYNAETGRLIELNMKYKVIEQLDCKAL